jgi:hypothetical protein
MSKVKVHESRKVKAVRWITKLYFVGALIGSGSHIIASAYKLGGHGIEAWVTPAMIDGIAIIGMVMRSADFSTRTNRIGFRVQCVMGGMSLILNVYAAKNAFGVLFGISIVALFIFAEWLSDQIEAREVEVVAEAEAAIAAASAWMSACNHPTKCESESQCQTKTAAAIKRSKTRRSNARKVAAKERVLQEIVNG